MKKFLFSIAFTLTIITVTQAQNFSGHYTIDSKEMIDGIEYLNAIAQEITVTQTKDSITITRVTPAGNDQTTTSTVALPLNGKVMASNAGNRKRTAVISFDKAKNTATIISTYSYEGKDDVQFKNTEIWELSADGTLTIIKTSDATETDDWTIKAIFKKV